MSSSSVSPSSKRSSSASFARRLLRRVSGHDEARGARIAQQRKRALHVGAREAEIDRQPLLPAVAFEPQRDLFDRLRRMRDPAPTENAPAVGHEAVDSELKLPLFVIAHRCIGKVGLAARILQEEDGLRWRWRAGSAAPARGGKSRHSSGGAVALEATGRIAASMGQDLEFTGERFIPGTAGEIWHEHWHRYHFAAPLVAGLDVLDVACGEGYGSALLATRAAKVIGADIAPSAVEHAALAVCGRRESRVPAGGLRGAAVRRRELRRGRLVRDDRAHHRPGGLSRRDPARAAARRPPDPLVPQQGGIHRPPRGDQRIPRPRALSRRARRADRLPLRARAVVRPAAQLLFGGVARAGRRRRARSSKSRRRPPRPPRPAMRGRSISSSWPAPRRRGSRRSRRACRCSPIATSGCTQDYEKVMRDLNATHRMRPRSRRRASQQAQRSSAPSSSGSTRSSRAPQAGERARLAAQDRAPAARDRAPRERLLVARAAAAPGVARADGKAALELTPAGDASRALSPAPRRTLSRASG